ncbi:serine/threonine-protein kinase [Tepidibacillus marianensis]|uniref:serine/threonine-protein kinase n=1 Tax=Tepidibacillus marianensis TaxID=3131995 RepID=UPI0030D40147
MSLLSKNKNISTLKVGSFIYGKWNKKEYRVIRHLGSGENGQVYLVDSQGRKFALKISMENVDLSYEIRIIQRLNDTQGLGLGFSLFDIDDYQQNTYELFPFYVMTYKQGMPLEQFLYGKNEMDYVMTFLHLLRMLKLYHDEGFACGDLKPEHLLVDPLTGTISFIDYGGVTLFHEGIRQYTELYDRGSWRRGIGLLILIMICFPLLCY